MTFKVTTICGSMRFYPQMLHLAERLTSEGEIVLMPFVTYNGGVKVEGDEFADMLDSMHKAKIDMSHGIYVVTGEHGYIGSSTRSEIDYATDHDKEIRADVLL